MPSYKKYQHSLSHYHPFTAEMGYIYPIACYETLPGDVVRASSSLLVRASPLNAPVMHPVQVRVHHFYVPSRILWTGWEDFITGGADGNDTSTVPTVTLSSPTVSSLSTYLGIPPVNNLVVSALQFRAYNAVVNRYYRDQDLVTEVAEDSMALQRCAWEKDYFTVARPWTQKGTEVSLPLGTTASLNATGDLVLMESDGTNLTAVERSSGTAATSIRAESAGSPAGANLRYSSGMQADLSSATAATINDLRAAFAEQFFKENRARFGSRYEELLAMYGIQNLDARLQHPEYLGGGRQNLAFSEVLQTAEGVSTDVGEMKGHGITAMRTNRFTRKIPEHGFVLSLMSVRPKAVYEDALHRQFLRTDKEDFYHKEYEGLGQQPITQQEVYADGSASTVFGYGDRYSEYRFLPSRVSGDFRTDLDHWHLARDLTGAPTLNASFVECNPSKRIHQVASGDTLWCVANNQVQMRRVVSPRPRPATL